jgi:hypothetical protein
MLNAFFNPPLFSLSASRDWLMQHFRLQDVLLLRCVFVQPDEVNASNAFVFHLESSATLKALIKVFNGSRLRFLTFSFLFFIFYWRKQ